MGLGPKYIATLSTDYCIQILYLEMPFKQLEKFNLRVAVRYPKSHDT